MFKGSFVALVTPMTEARALDWGALDALVDWHLEAGTHGFVPVGTTGESPTLDIPDHLKVIERVIARVSGRRPVLAGTGSNATDEAILMTREAQAMGAAGSLQVAYNNKPTREGLFQHFSAIADAVPMPVVLYNVPGRTVADLMPETVARLAAIPASWA